MSQMPAISLAAVPGRRAQTVELAVEAEKRGFVGIFGPSMGDAVSLMLSIAHATNEIRFGTSVQPLYFRHPIDMAGTAAYIHEISGGRFYMGIGVSHGPVHDRFGLEPGKPLADTRDYVGQMRAAEKAVGELPPIVLATLRDKMVALSVEVGDGAVWANASLNAMPESLAKIPTEVRDGDFYIGNMIPTVIDDDKKAAGDRNRKTLAGYVQLPNYRNYWKQAGYVEEMEAVESAMADKDFQRIPSVLSDRWLSSCTLYGPANEVREGVEAWYDAGVKCPILVPSSINGGQMVAIAEMFDTFSN